MIDHLAVARNTFGRLATSIMFNPAKGEVVALNNKNATGKPISVAVQVEPATTFGPRVNQAMLSMREQLNSAKGPA